MADKTRLIILEGISGSGKSTLLREINVRRDFNDHHWHRFTATKWVYGTINRRDICLEDLRKNEEKIQKIWPTTLVTLVCDPYLALKRKSEMPNEHIENDIAIANKLFLVYHNYLTVIKRKIVICTNDRTVEECANLILKRVLA